ncbi:putative reductase [compost metagenome]
MFAERLYAIEGTSVDEEGRIRIDDWEMSPDVQNQVTQIWDKLTTDNIYELTDLESYKQEFFQLFGFETEGVDYEAETDPDVTVTNQR